MKILIALTAILMLLISLQNAEAHGIYVCDANGNEKDSFYTNETVYVKGSVPYPNNESTVYIINSSTSWSDQANLSVNLMFQALVSTNSSNIIPVTIIWGDPKAGQYDVVMDLNGNGTYDSAIDHVDNLTSVGFSVYDVPTTYLKASLSSNTPSSFSVNAGNINATTIMHFFLEASRAEDITVSDITLSALGTGNDKEGISYAKLIEDVDGDGVYNKSVDDGVMELCQYSIDNGICTFTFTGGYKINVNETAYFLVQYIFTTNVSSGDAFQFQIPGITARITGETDLLKTPNLPLNSAIATITGTVATTTTTTETTTTTAATTTTTETTTAVTTTTTEAESILPSIDSTIVLIVAVVVIVIVFVIIVFFYLASKSTSSVIIKESE